MLAVAVGVLVRADGAVLFGQRRAGTPYAGWWEFPGGKLERGENVEQALARELHEELGITVRRSDPWIVREHRYAHAHVALTFRRVVDWLGTPRAREGQALAWCHPGQVDLAPLLPAAIRPLAGLRLPPTLGISCAAQIGTAAFLERLQAALARGLRLVQLREPAMADEPFDRLWRQVRALCRMAGAGLVVNSRHGPARAQAADGVHLRSVDLHRCTRRPAMSIVGASCHDARDLEQAARLDVDYAVLGPVRPTPTHPEATGLGWTRFAQLAAPAQIPVYALGGLGPGDRGEALRAGAHGLAMLRAAWPAPA